MSFVKATRKKAKLRLGITGPSGSGKTRSALELAKGIGGRIALVDTENESASLYSDICDFDTMALTAPFEPERYISAIKEAEEAGYNVLVIDSITHEWTGKGGILEIHENRSKVTKNSYTAWADVTPRHNAFIEAILQSKIHIIVTMRSKQDYVLADRGGKQVPQKVGMAPIQREGFEYELTVVFDLTLEGHIASASKDRTRMFDNRNFVITEKTGIELLNWLDAGVAVAPVEKPKDWKQIGTEIGDALKAAKTLDELNEAYANNEFTLTEMHDAAPVTYKSIVAGYEKLKAGFNA